MTCGSGGSAARAVSDGAVGVRAHMDLAVTDIAAYVPAEAPTSPRLADETVRLYAADAPVLTIVVSSAGSST